MSATSFQLLYNHSLPFYTANMFRNTNPSLSANKQLSVGRAGRSFLTIIIIIGLCLLPLSCKKKKKIQGVEETTVTANGVTFTMIQVIGGSFVMGSEEGNADAEVNEKPARKVTVSNFWIGKTEVTQQLWQAVMGSNPSYFKGHDLPVEQVSWNDCQEFIKRLNNLTGRQFRLPTEAEWEYAARGGTRTSNYKYSGGNTSGDVAWYWGNANDKTHSVGRKRGNELGICDMTGNVWEWCQDWYGYYHPDAQHNPKGAKSGRYRVNRGGAWCFEQKAARNTARFANRPDGKYKSVGLRLVMR